MGTDIRIASGRAGDMAAIEIAEQLESIGLSVERLKTGTPPRVEGRTIDYEKMGEQVGELQPSLTIIMIC